MFLKLFLNLEIFLHLVWSNKSVQYMCGIKMLAYLSVLFLKMHLNELVAQLQSVIN